jgi:hypothetical protein
VRATGEAGDQGLTVMALLDEARDALALPQTTAPAPMPEVTPVNPADLQALEDYRIADAARSALGIGTWHYDASSDSIIEDEGMRALIGRAFEGGPTLISDEDQSRADAAFVQLMSGDIDDLSLDIRIVHRDGEHRWITLKGQGKTTSEGRQMFGIAYDVTDWKRSLDARETTPVEPVIQTPALTQDDLEAAVAVAKAEAKMEAKAEAMAEIRAQLQADAEAAASTDHPYGWTSPAPTVEPVAPPEPNAELIAENEALKDRLEQLQAMAIQASDPAHMQKRIDDLSAALIEARQYETVGRMTNDVAQDFADMLGVINNALEVMARQSDNPESVRRLSEAALAAGKRGERLTRQLQALQSEEN